MSNLSELQIDELNRTRALELASFIVEAPAGAGKTELLTQRFLKLLQTVNEPEEVIAITFTNKAAAEMRLRILDSLQKAAKGELPSQMHKQTTFALSMQVLKKSKQFGWNLIDNPARLRIFTIDGLCAYLARQMPLMSRFGTQPSVAEDANIHYTQAAERTLDLIDDKANGHIVKEVLRYLDNDANQLKKLLIRMLGMRDQWLHYAQETITQDNLQSQLQSTLHHVVSEELVEIARVVNAPIQHALMPLARYAASNLDCEHSISLLRDWDTQLSSHAESLSMWQSLADLLLTGKGAIRKKVTVTEGFSSEAKAQKQAFTELLNSFTPDIESALARVRSLPSIQQQTDSWHIIAKLSQLLNLAAAELWLVFQQDREVDFVEVAQRASQALAGNTERDTYEPTDLALRLDYQIKHLLVDEFQDTSPSQIELLERLIQGWQEGDGRTFFAVGDPMQSIYRFRKANVGLFLNVASDGIGDLKLERLRLYRNNRSCPPVINWINNHFASIFPPADNTAKGTIAYRQFIATKQDDAGTGIEVHPIIKLADESLEQAKAREALAIIKIIEREQTQYPNRKIAILVRAKTHLHALVTELRRNYQHIRFQAVEIEALSNRQIVQDLLALTRALHHRADRVNWLATLRAPWCGLSLEDMHKLVHQHPKSTVWSLIQNAEIRQQLTIDGQKRLAHIQEIFSEAFATQGRVNVSRWVRGVWLMLGGASCLWEEADVVDVQAFFACIEQLDRSDQFSLERMAQEIDKLFAAPDANGASLQMMSIHKSKGLEFDTVILPGLGNTIGGNDDKPIVLWEEVNVKTSRGHVVELLAAPIIPKGLKDKETVSPYEYLAGLEKERAKNEDARVLYVAATRAERKLHLVGIANQGEEAVKPTKNTYLDLLWPAVIDAYNEAEIAEPVSLQAENGLASFIPKLVRLETLEIPVELKANKLQVLSHAKAKELAHDYDAEQSDISLQANIGTLTHRYLEIIAQQRLEKWSAERISSLSGAMQYWFNQQGYSSAESMEAAKQVQKLLTTALASEDGRWLLQTHEQGVVEHAVSVLDNEALNTYVVDRAFTTQDTGGNKVRWIVDYKTVDLPIDIAEAALKAIAQQYKDQLNDYAKLFAQEGNVIKQAIFFVSLGKLVEI